MSAPTRAPEVDVPARVARLADLGMQTAVLLHELRQPLFALKATAELVLAAPTPAPDTVDAWSKVLAQVRQIELLVARYADVGRDGDDAVLVDLVDPVRAAVEVHQDRAAGRGVTLRADLPAGPLWVLGQEGALRQIVLNLVQNAVDAVEDAPVRQVVVRAVAGAGRVTVEVGDSGPGIDPAVLPRVFEPFVTTKAPGRGTGLGLFVTQALVAEAGGSLEIDSGAEGTTVRVALPVAR